MLGRVLGMRTKAQRMVFVRCIICQQTTAHGLCEKQTCWQTIAHAMQAAGAEAHLPSGLGP
jgi:hypothetical protein